MPISEPLSRVEYQKHEQLARFYFDKNTTKFGQSTFSRNQQLVQLLHAFSHEPPRDLVLAALYYQLPEGWMHKLPRGVKRIVQQANGLSASSLDREHFLQVVSKGKLKPAAFLVNLASALRSLKDPAIPQEEKQRIGRIALDVHSPLAGSLGLYWIQHEIGNLALKHGYPDHYHKFVKTLTQGEREFEKHVLPKMRDSIRNAAETLGVHYEFSHRVKQPFSAYVKWRRKLAASGVEPNALLLPDKVGMRVVLYGGEEHCYTFLEKLKGQHGINVKLEDDYVKTPKPNGYKSLHVLVKKKGQKHWFELQIRTHDMHVKAESEDPSQVHWVHKLQELPPEAVQAVKTIAKSTSALLNGNHRGE